MQLLHDLGLIALFAFPILFIGHLLNKQTPEYKKFEELLEELKPFDDLDHFNHKLKLRHLRKQKELKRQQQEDIGYFMEEEEKKRRLRSKRRKEARIRREQEKMLSKRISDLIEENRQEYLKTDEAKKQK